MHTAERTLKLSPKASRHSFADAYDSPPGILYALVFHYVFVPYVSGFPMLWFPFFSTYLISHYASSIGILYVLVFHSFVMFVYKQPSQWREPSKCCHPQHIPLLASLCAHTDPSHSNTNIHEYFASIGMPGVMKQAIQGFSTKLWCLCV